MAEATLSGGSGGTITIPFDTAGAAGLAQQALSSITSTLTFTPGVSTPTAPAGGGAALVIGPNGLPTGAVTVPGGYAAVVNTATAPVTLVGGGDSQIIISSSGGLNYFTGGGSDTVVAAGGDNLIGTS